MIFIHFKDILPLFFKQLKTVNKLCKNRVISKWKNGAFVTSNIATMVLWLCHSLVRSVILLSIAQASLRGANMQEWFRKW